MTRARKPAKAPRVALTGVPGVGKTSLGEALAARGHPVLFLADYVKDEGLLGRADRARDTREVDVRKLARAFARDFPTGPLFVEGHLSHHLPVDAVLVLRASPATLARRLRARGYKQAKVQENVEAEALDVVPAEVLSLHPRARAAEVDATRRGLPSLARIAEDFATARAHPALKPLGTHAFLPAFTRLRWTSHG